ncbi:MAG: membrane protein insertion efficiency factor YidD [Kiritimatiellia bacterium]|jgi:putative component of membrane protein insertase Oxa1/YidC/SpoIIIJ protein YidD|nr:membrane protein insertion efficiency factor YidD [Kiritimatiellia bacterium]MDP6631280.1 membrane protein insertion efficiency factor YidD [Kiritimatiellia bacterium]MDP6809611.1 membrane protein insertion efficiency factor YidD [Kiritimatiellia bacterium]MDP7023538.1 membrane protein insertion efficiency factor YidD [Kiritimatiellia bacterium]
MVGFYRIVVAQSIGSRCVLEPSCSTYSLQAARERGWLGIPMTGDRLIREPSVVHAKEHPVGVINGRTHYADPVSDHIGGDQ